MGPAAHVLPPGHPPARVSSGSSSGAHPLGRTSRASLGLCSARGSRINRETISRLEKLGAGAARGARGTMAHRGQPTATVEVVLHGVEEFVGRRRAQQAGLRSQAKALPYGRRRRSRPVLEKLPKPVAIEVMPLVSIRESAHVASMADRLMHPTSCKPAVAPSPQDQGALRPRNRPEARDTGSSISARQRVIVREALPALQNEGRPIGYPPLP